MIPEPTCKHCFADLLTDNEKIRDICNDCLEAGIEWEYLDERFDWKFKTRPSEDDASAVSGFDASPSH
jgi:hypothetical protein